MKFSQRQWIVKPKDALQLESMDDDLKNSLWNLVFLFYLDGNDSVNLEYSLYKSFFKDIRLHFLKKPIDKISDYCGYIIEDIRKLFFNREWFEIYDFIEYISKIKSPTDSSRFRETCNKVLERELSWYRFIWEELVPITDINEIEAIENTLESANILGLIWVKTHIKTALLMLSDKKSPDYRNSIKESISAVESIGSIISWKSSDTLWASLDKIKGKLKIHPSLERGFKSIYWYTSDDDGIRHSIIEEPTCDQEDAIFMLVASSAFINYLIVKCNKAWISLN